ncbi:MAG: cell division protein FtsQ [Massilibacteroides sp.]|nr:cell division protein FtsQ [Massilibacteroides sp.]MDD3062019.1 cell division protein FtsQ [Massilibacteroides sp.]MDD4115648.1 cell division protein FtsQ [Massilibacteroides sp.]MDD4659264.1 cell division protein FtsQ [Massilibacteroides sp.]
MIRILTILIGALLLTYIAFASYFFTEIKRNDICKSIEIVVKDSLDKHFVTKTDLTSFLKQKKIYPVNKLMTEINTDQIEQTLLGNEMIALVEAYKTPSGILKMEVEQKIPILRVISPRGNFYVDNRGTLMPISSRYAAHVPVASGYIEKGLAVTDLYKFALFLQGNKFWNAQIEQIYIHPDGEVDLIPRIGNHRIVLGTFEKFEEKLDNLRLFYDLVIPKMGWEKYSIINLKYKNQIVCTKR